MKIPPGYVAVDKPTVSDRADGHRYPCFLGIIDGDAFADFYSVQQLTPQGITWLDFADRARLQADLELAHRTIEALSKEPRTMITVEQFSEATRLQAEADTARRDEEIERAGRIEWQDAADEICGCVDPMQPDATVRGLRDMFTMLRDDRARLQARVDELEGLLKDAVVRPAKDGESWTDWYALERRWNARAALARKVTP